MQGLEGTRLGRYFLRQKLGHGGMSEVYLATDELMHRDVAVKVVSSVHTDYVERFQREVEAIGTLQHSHILPAYDFGEQPPWYYLVMPYIGYCTLLDKLEQGPLSLEYAGELLTQIAGGLQFAHDHGVIHRDIKPSNILMRDDHFVYLADFGLAKSVEGADRVTQTGVLLGTPEYMAPELAEGPPDKSSDIYALGILLYQMVTGKMPFSGDTPLAVYLKQLREQPVPPSRVRPGIPRSVELVILRVLEKDPRRRFDSPVSLARAYKQALHDQQPAASSHYETTPMGNDLLRQEAIRPSGPPSPGAGAPPEPIVPAAPIAPAAPVQPRLPPQPPQQEKLVLPPSLQQAQPHAPPQRPQEPTAPYRRVPARSARTRSPRISLALVIALIFLVFTVILFGIGLSAYNHQSKNPLSNLDLTQTAAGNGVTPSPARASPGASLTAQAEATQQAIYGQATADTSGTPLLSDPLSSNTNNRWTDDGVTCAFQGGAYHVLVNRTSYLQPCSPQGYTFDNCAIMVDVALLQGNDAGFIFRQNGDQFYDFEINDQGQYYFRRHDANAGASYVPLVSSAFSSAIHNGTAPNTLMVIANNSDFLLFINGTFVNEVHDSTYTSGKLALVAGTLETASNADASFANLNVYPVLG
jgi:serine/threonine protein kinase